MTSDVKKAMRALTAGIMIAFALMLASYAGTCSAQEIIPRENDRPQLGRVPPGFSRTAFMPEILPPLMPSEAERLRLWKLREEEAKRDRLIGFVRTIESEGLDKGRELKVVSRGHRVQTGYVIGRTAESFTLVDFRTQQETDIQFSEIESLHVVRGAGENAKRVAMGIGVGLLVIVTLPLTIFGAIIGWDGC